MLLIKKTCIFTKNGCSCGTVYVMQTPYSLIHTLTLITTFLSHPIKKKILSIKNNKFYYKFINPFAAHPFDWHYLLRSKWFPLNHPSLPRKLVPFSCDIDSRCDWFSSRPTSSVACRSCAFCWSDSASDCPFGICENRFCLCTCTLSESSSWRSRREMHTAADSGSNWDTRDSRTAWMWRLRAWFCSAPAGVWWSRFAGTNMEPKSKRTWL